MKRVLVSITLILTLMLLAEQSFASRFYPPEKTPPLPTGNLDKNAYELLLNRWLADCSDDNCKVWADLTRAKLWLREKPDQSCELLSKLNLDGPVLPVILIHQAQACGMASNSVAIRRPTVERIQKYIKENKPRRWLELALTESALPLARSYDSDLFITLSASAARLSKIKENKQQYLTDALALAEKEKPYRVGEIRQQLYKTFPRFNPAPDDWWTVGLDSLQGRDFKLAIKAFKKVMQDSKQTLVIRRQAYENLRQAYKFQNDKPKALETAKALWAFDQKTFRTKDAPPESAKYLYTSSLELAKLLWTDHQSANARVILDQTEKMLGGKVNKGELYFIRGKLDEEIKRFDSALKWMDLAIKNSPDLAANNLYLWTSSWLLFKLERYDEAIHGFKILKTTEVEPGRRAQQSYWLGRALEAKGASDEAKAEFENLIKDDPLGYYYLLAYRALKRPIPKMGDLSALASQKQKQGTEVFEWLVSLGDTQLASQMQDEESPFPDQPTEVNDLWETYARANHYAPIFMKVIKLSPQEKQKILSEHPWLLFPTPFKEIVSEASARFGLWPEFVFSIIRQESIFDPYTKSKAHAYGLMQLLPEVAEKLAVKEGHHHKGKDDLVMDLYDPAFNVSWGTRLLRQYFNIFEGQPLMTAAGYNAGPDVVKAWTRTRFHGDVLQFIEDIPYEETRVYVKLVLRNIVNYLRLQSPEPQIDFPEWCIEGVHPLAVHKNHSSKKRSAASLKATKQKNK